MPFAVRAPESAPTAPRPEDERLPLGRTAVHAVQHVLTMYGGLVAVPLVVAGAAGYGPQETALLVAAALFVGGFATFVQAWGLPRIGSQLPLVQGVSFTGIATMLSVLASDGGMPSVMGSIMVASLIGFLAVPFFAKVLRFFPPVVTGTIITTIGITLVPVAAGWAMGGDAGAPDHGSPANIALAGFTLLLVLVLSRFGGPAVSRLAILLAVLGGTVVAWLLGVADFSAVGEGTWFALPSVLHFGAPTFELAAVVAMTIVIFVNMAETTADIMALGEITGSRVDARRIADGLRADMLSSAVAPVFNSFTQTAFVQNVGLVAITKVRSRYVVALGGAFMVVLGMLPVLGQVIAAIPLPVMGGAGVVLFGTVMSSGIRTLARVDYRGGANLVVVAVALSFGMVPIVVPAFYAQFPDWVGVIFSSGISSAAVMALVLNLLFNELGGRRRTEAMGMGAVGLRVLSPREFAALQDGDTFVDGRLVDAHGREVPHATSQEQYEALRARIESGELSSVEQVREACRQD
ncbi:nucleobase:cation symporter-2 family protein [Kocuria sp.]|uniref:nucleobase:cation symporter-2 family protein n=1 Tax=Kocuria sp. TaxID=1871328 RepID=UPI002810CE9B|nr:nucleobase:cation symporter-2 family protein [Kocuria sp.]